MGIWEQLHLNMAAHRLVALVGAGGKTSTLYALAKEGVEAGRREVESGMYLTMISSQ